MLLRCRFYDFIDYIEQTTFGIACDAQSNFKVSGVSGTQLLMDGLADLG